MEQKKRNQLLLATKLTMPSPPLRRVIARERLHCLLDVGMQGPLTLLTAPAGFGKTTLLSHWLRQREIPNAWVTLERSDNNLACFWHYVIAALNQLHPFVEEQIQEWLAFVSPLNLEELLTSVINALMELPHAVALVLDDYQSITDPAVHSSLTFLLEHLPPHLHLIVATREEPALPLARLRVRGQVTELRASQLCFTQEEVAALFAERGSVLSTETLTALYRRTGGWAAGLHLATLALEGGDEPSTLTHVIQRFIGAQRHVSTYLSEEVLAQLPEDVQDFLLVTSILDQLSAALCEAVTHRPTSAALLVWLEQAGLFLLPLDERGEWYRYQPLFREVLQHHLQQRQATQVAELHQRASLWYEQQGLLVEAVQHALAAAEVERAATLIENRACFLLQQEEERQEEERAVHNCIDQLPRHVIATHPILSYLEATRWLAIGHFPEYERALLRAEEGWHADHHPELLSRVCTLRASAALLCGDGFHAAAWAQQALTLAPREDDLTRDTAIVMLGAGYLLTGGLVRARTTLSEGYRLSQLHCHFTLMQQASLYLGDLQVVQGRLREATETFHRLLLEAGERMARLRIIAHLRLGSIYLEWNELNRAMEQWQQAHLLLERLAPDRFGRAEDALLAARLAWARGELEQVVVWLDRAEQEARHLRNERTMLAKIDALREQVLLANGSFATIQMSEWEATLAEGEHWPYEREAQALRLARFALAQDRPEEASEFLEEVLAAAQAQERLDSAIRLLVPLALAYQAQGKWQQALETLEGALALGEAGGYIRVFVEEGADLAALLIECALQAQKRALQEKGQTFLLRYVRRVMAALRAETPISLWSQSVLEDGGQRLVEPLSEREQDVLALMAEGLSNQEMARRLVVTVSTVKTHLNNLYMKLGVHTRLQAVTTAYEIGLLKKGEADTSPLPHLPFLGLYHPQR